MCLITKQKEPLIADNDIKVYKLLTVNSRSCFMNFKYIVDKLYETEFTFSDTEVTSFDRISNNELDKEFGEEWRGKVGTELKSIVDGFHAVLRIDRFDGIYSDDVIYVYECIVPKGSEYYLDNNDCIVSNKIIIKENLQKYPQ